MNTRNKLGRPALLSTTQIIECALTSGLPAISMNSLGKKLGVSATALYRHVSSKEQLIALCCDHVMKKVTPPNETEWEECLFTFAKNFRKVLLSIPGAVEFIRYNQQFTPSTNILIDHILGILRQSKFEAEISFMAFACVYTRVTDIVQHQEQSKFRHKNSTDSINLENLPNLAWLMEQKTPVNYDKYFDDGIKITIEGLKAVYN